ncbi:hypothetical protein LCGC14_2470120 [marine sediment metagenome]|uniref:Methyltransferase type 11 domain-containing protein n=1 Tax=marine sediment metagenome TaxID=412755 RepID=A0A0F9BBA9_9ZZZZ
MEVQEHTLPAPEGLQRCARVLDVGAGIRPMQWYEPDLHLCLDPYQPYCDVLDKAGYMTTCMTALEGLQQLWRYGGHPAIGAIYLLDVLEHMPKELGKQVLTIAKKLAQVQVVIYTPYGFKEQTKDVWEMGGDQWLVKNDDGLDMLRTGVADMIPYLIHEE